MRGGEECQVRRKTGEKEQGEGERNILQARAILQSGVDAVEGREGCST